MNQLFLYIIFIQFSLLNFHYSQVAPFILPYSLEQNGAKISSFNLEEGEMNNFVEFMNYADLTVFPDKKIWSLTINFTTFKKGYVSINNWNVPNGANLFILWGENAYSGPYPSKQNNHFISGRFAGNRITLEYNEPVNSEFEGSFTFGNFLSDNDPAEVVIKYPVIPSIKSTRERPKIMVTGYWPPTNEMVRHFSQSEELNPAGWQGENWENSGYDVVSFFPEFNPPDCNNCGQGYGDLEVDYQDFSQDFWPIIEAINPVGIITFSRGYNDHSWELENRVVNRTNWVDDYTTPLLPTPNPPDNSVNNYHVRYTSLPVEEIIAEIERSGLGLDAYLDNTNAGMFLSEFAGYHGSWYKEDHDDNSEIPCFASGHIHVGAQIDWDSARLAAEISIRTLIEYIDQFMVLSGDCNSDGAVNILDVVALANVILGNDEFTPSQSTAADLDGNGILNILDIIAIVNLILN